MPAVSAVLFCVLGEINWRRLTLVGFVSAVRHLAKWGGGGGNCDEAMW